ncbi:MAG: hypothetical protein LBB04_01150 [Oscillospiraceae bacterium]|jgi:Na+-translocating ferredoxin:NAD+ oxidoreductase RnfE subunit|nr:hypothetical protein [Oscillospiraceae bacterium]
MGSNGIWRRIKSKNEFFLTQLFIAPIVICGNSWQAGLVFSFAVVLVVLASEIISNTFRSRLYVKLGAIFNIFISCLIYIPVFILFKENYPYVVDSNKIYLPILVLHTFAFSDSKVFTKTGNAYKPFGLLNSVLYVLFFSVQILLISGLREWLSGHRFWGPGIAGFAFPFGGFIIMGFVLAGINKLAKIESAEHEA